MSSFLSPYGPGDDNGGEGPSRSFSGQSLQGLDIELGNTSLEDRRKASYGQPQSNMGLSRASTSLQSFDPGSSSLEVRPQDHYHREQSLMPPPKRKRYSTPNDDASDGLSLKVPKVRTPNRHPQAIAPGIGQYLDNDFSSLPASIRASLVTILTAKSTAQRKTTDRMLSCLNPPLDTTTRFDIIGKISYSIDILYNVAKFLRPKDIINLYSISRDFHRTLDGNMQSTIVQIAAFICPLPAQIFPHHFYAACTMPDPAGRPRDPAYHDIFARLSATPSLAAAHHRLPDDRNPAKASETRKIPSLVWLTMVHARHVRVRDIMACLARQGHRLPAGTYCTLLKIWLIMDLPTNADRATVIKTKKYFTRFDLYRSALFLVKLSLRMNDPLYGPDHTELLKLMLGQRGLSPLWELLRGKKYDKYIDILQLKIRYNVAPTSSQYEYGVKHNRGICGVPITEMGQLHLEHWGQASDEPPSHLLRPDELIIRESARRNLAIEPHLESMMVYGHVDVAKGIDLVPTLDELYMSDSELEDPIPDDEMDPHDVVTRHGAGNVPFGDWEWTPKLARKAVWDDLTEEQRQLILEDDRDEYLMSLRWEVDSEDSLVDSSGEEEEDPKKRRMSPVKRVRPRVPTVLPRVVVHDSDDNSVEDHVSATSYGQDNNNNSRSSSPEYPTFNLQPPGHQDRRVFSTDSMAFPELGSSSRVTSMASTRIVTPHLGPGGGDVRIHDADQDHPMEDIDEADYEESTIMPGSSLNVTPRKGVPSSQPSHQDMGDSDDGDDEHEEDDDEDDEGDGDCSDGGDSVVDHDDEELKAQGYESYPESEFEYDWDGFMEEYEWEKEAQAGHDDGEYQQRF